MVESLRFCESEILLNYELKILKLCFVKIIFPGRNIAFTYFAGLGSRSKPHIRQAMIRPVIYQLSGSLTTYSPKQFVLYFFEKVECKMRIGVVVLLRR